MALFKGSEKISSQIGLTQYADVTELMKYMNTSIGDVGQVVFPLNESENKRRYLNGQIISQVQFPKFTEKLKNAVSLFPQISCTEEEWQTIALNDPDKQCGKFVIDDVTQTIRLPRIKYLVGNLNLYNISQGIPNRRLVKYKRPTDTDRSWYEIYSDGWVRQGNQMIITSDVETRYSFLIPYNITLSQNPISEGKMVGNGCFQKEKVIFYLCFCRQYQVEARHGKAFEGLLKRYFG